MITNYLKTFKNTLIHFITNFIAINFGYHEYLVLHYKYGISIEVYIVENVMISEK